MVKVADITYYLHMFSSRNNLECSVFLVQLPFPLKVIGMIHGVINFALQ